MHSADYLKRSYNTKSVSGFLVMSDGSKKSQGLDNVPKVRLASKEMPPTVADLQLLLKESKQAVGTAVEWHWQTRAGKRSFTLSARISSEPDSDDDEYYDENPDEPLWLFKDNRSHGNSVIWQEKTTDLDLILSIIETHCQSDIQEQSQEIKKPAPKSAVVPAAATPVFSDLMTMDEQGLIAMGYQQLHAAIRSFAVNLFTGRVDITKNLESAYLFFEYGVPVHASAGSATGDIALVEMMSWHMGVVSYQMDERSIARSVTKSIEWLISEGGTLLEQKKFLGRVGLAYESSLVKTGKTGGGQVVSANEDLLLKKKILNHLSRPCTLTDMLRDLQVEVWEWVPAMFHLFNQGQIAFQPPEPERSTALKFLNGTKSGAQDAGSPLLSPEPRMYKYEALMIFLAREFQRFKEHGRIFSLVLFDIKGGGNSNRLRPLSPDTVAALARKIDLLKRPVDVFADFDIGTGTYALLLPDTDVRKSTILARCIHQVLELSSLNVDEHGISVASGIAGLPEHGNDLESLVAASRQAMELARKTRVPILVGQRGALLSKPPTGSGPSYMSHARARADSDQFGISLEDLMVKASIVTREKLESALSLSRQMHTPLSMVLTMSGVDLSKKTVSLSEEVHDLIKERELTAEEGVSTLEYANSHDASVEAALKKLGLFKRQSAVTPLGKLLSEAKIIEDDVLSQASKDSVRTGLPLGYLLISQELISRSILHAGLNVLRLCRNESFNREDGIRALKAVASGSKSFKEYCQDHKISLAPIEAVGLGEILMMAEVISESELMTAREIALSGGTDLQGALIEHGFTSVEYLTLARQYRDKIESGALTAEEATEKFKRAVEARGKIGRPEGETTVQGRVDPSLTSGVHTRQPKFEEVRSAKERTADVRTSPERPVGETTIQERRPATFAAPQPAGGTPATPARPSQAPPLAQQPPQKPAGPPPGASQPLADRPASTTGEFRKPAASEAPGNRVGEVALQGRTAGGAQQKRMEPSMVHVDPEKGVDRIDLLLCSGIIDNQQAEGARKLAATHGTSPIRILFDRGSIDQDSLNLAAAAKRKIDSGDVTVEKAVLAIVYCKRNKVDFDTGVAQV